MSLTVHFRGKNNRESQGCSTGYKKNYPGLMAIYQNLNFKKLFWVITGLLAVIILLYPLEGENAWVMKFLLVLLTPIVTISIGFCLAFLEILWEAFAPLFKRLKSWFYR